MVPGRGPRRMPVILSSYRLGPGQRASYKTVPPPWDWLLRRENELGPRRSKSQIIFAVLVPPLYVAVQAPALIVTAIVVTASSGTAISTDFATLTCSEILSKILIRCVTWHWACDCSFRCFHEIGRYFDNKEQERAKTRARRHDRSQRRQEHPKIDSFWGANTGFIDFQHYATLCSRNR